MKLVRTVGGFLTGGVTGLAVVVIAIFGTIFAAWALNSPVELPGVFSATVIPTQDVPEITFVPNLLGLLGLVLVCAAIGAALGAFSSRKARA